MVLEVTLLLEMELDQEGPDQVELVGLKLLHVDRLHQDEWYEVSGSGPG